MKKLFFTLFTLLSGLIASAQCNVSFTANTIGSQVTVTNTTNWTLVPGSTPLMVVGWGDGSPVSPISYVYGSTVSHTYSTPGTYSVFIEGQYYDTLNNAWICFDTTSQQITVNQPCASTISMTNNGGGSYTFTANNIGGGTGINYVWNFGDGTGGTGASVTHTYTNSGNYVVSLASSTSGCVDSTFTTVQYFNGTLNCNNLFASFYIFSNMGLTITCVNQSTGVFNLPMIVSNKATWDFGDNTPAVVGNNPTHTYGTAGTYTITMINQWVDSVNTSVVYCTDTTIQTVTVTPAPPQPNIISGNVFYDSTVVNLAQMTFKVWLIEMDSVQMTLTAVDSLIVNGWSNYIPYSFQNEPAGSYRIKAAVLSGTTGANLFVPTYHVGSAMWNGATVITHTGGSSINKDIYMITGTSSGGPGFIGGNISQGANKGTNGGVPGILVMLRNANNDIVRFTYTDGNGDYSFGNIPAGMYNVYPEHMNYITIPSSAISIASGQYQASGIDFEHTSTHIQPITTSIKNINSDLFRIYPNPSAGNILLTWSSNVSEMAEIQVADITGRVVFNTSTKTNASTSMDLSRLQPGVYFIKVTTDKAQHSEKILIQR